MSPVSPLCQHLPHPLFSRWDLSLSGSTSLECSLQLVSCLRHNKDHQQHERCARIPTPRHLLSRPPLQTSPMSSLPSSRTKTPEPVVAPRYQIFPSPISTQTQASSSLPPQLPDTGITTTACASRAGWPWFEASPPSVRARQQPETHRRRDQCPPFRRCRGTSPPWAVR